MRCVNILSRPLARARRRPRRPAARRPARARRRCSAGWRSSAAGSKRRAADGQAGRQAEPRDGHQRPGLLGEVRQLLGRRDAARADGGRPLPPLRRGGREALRREHDRRRRDPRLDLRRLVRAGRGDLRGARRPAGEDRARRAGARRRRVGRVRRAVPRPGPRVGLPAAAGRLDQRVGPQVRARLPGRRLDRLARRGGAARGPDLLGQLPRRQHADVRAQLLAAGRAGRRAVLQLPAARLRRLPAGAGLRARRGDAARRRRSPSSGRSS